MSALSYYGEWEILRVNRFILIALLRRVNGFKLKRNKVETGLVVRTKFNHLNFGARIQVRCR